MLYEVVLIVSLLHFLSPGNTNHPQAPPVARRLFSPSPLLVVARSPCNSVPTWLWERHWWCEIGGHEAAQHQYSSSSRSFIDKNSWEGLNHKWMVGGARIEQKMFRPRMCNLGRRSTGDTQKLWRRSDREQAVRCRLVENSILKLLWCTGIDEKSTSGAIGEFILTSPFSLSFAY